MLYLCAIFSIQTILNSNNMKISHIEHLGIAVPSIEEALPYFKNVLGLDCYAIEEVADQKVKTAFLKCGEVKLELLEPTSPESTKGAENLNIAFLHPKDTCGILTELCEH